MPANKHTDEDSRELAALMDWFTIRAVIALAAFGLIAAIYACQKAYGAPVAIAVTLGAIPMLLITIGFVTARDRKPRPDNT
jgi:archaellum biogenesis protein FlaJ (TadC family)